MGKAKRPTHAAVEDGPNAAAGASSETGNETPAAEPREPSSRAPVSATYSYRNGDRQGKQNRTAVFSENERLLSASSETDDLAQLKEKLTVNNLQDEEDPEVFHQNLQKMGEHAAPPGITCGKYHFSTAHVVTAGILGIIAFGVVFGASVPSKHIEKPWNYISGIIGWTYFAAWSISFYPQVYLNWARKSVVGYSFDYQLMNLIGFTAYSVYNCAYFWDTEIKKQYRSHNHGHTSSVQANDVFFSLHALFFTIITILQSIYYQSGNQRVSMLGWVILAVSVSLSGTWAILIVAGVNGEAFSWLQWLLVISYIKLFVTLVKYLSQVRLNWQRKSTIGFNIWNVMLDISGGTLSVLQQLMDSAIKDDWSAIAGDPVKFGLGTASMIFDVVLMIQHFCLYAENNRKLDRIAEETLKKKLKQYDEKAPLVGHENYHEEEEVPK